MAHMADVEKIRAMRDRYPDLAVVCYINSTAKLKQYADVCVTSANAVKVVKALPNKHIYFIPDQHLGSFVAAQVPEKEVIVGDGYCPVHHQITAEEVRQAKKAHPGSIGFRSSGMSERGDRAGGLCRKYVRNHPCGGRGRSKDLPDWDRDGSVL